MNLTPPVFLPRVTSGPAFSTGKRATADDWSDIEALLQSPAEVRPLERAPVSGRARVALSPAPAPAPAPARRYRGITFIASPAMVSVLFAAMLTCAFWSPASKCRSRFDCTWLGPAGVQKGQVAALSKPEILANASAMAPLVEGRSSSETKVAEHSVDARAAVGGPPYGSLYAADGGPKTVQDLDLRLRRLQTANDRQAADIELLKQRLEALASRSR